MGDEKTPSKLSQVVKLLFAFVVPAIVLLTLSDESRLGPARAMLVALSFPVALEAYSLVRNRKPSVLSLVAIGGILVTGLISLMGLNEDWLAVRRSIPYFAGALLLVGSMFFKRPLINAALAYILDMQQVHDMAARKQTTAALRKRIMTTNYWLIFLLLVVGISSYILTLVVINSPTDTTAFNAEYVRLRVLSIPFTVLPLFVGVMAILMYLLSGIEKLTGLQADKLLRKKKL